MTYFHLDIGSERYRTTLVRILSIRSALIIAAMLGSFLPAAHAQSPYASAVLANNPVAYFRLGSTNAGSSVNGFTTTFNNGATVTPPGGGAPLSAEPNNVGAALPGNAGSYVGTSLDGQAAYATGGNATILAWVRLDQLPSVAGRYFYVAGRSQFGNDLDLQFQNDNSLYFYTDSGSATVYTPSPSSLLGTYHFIAATVDTTTGVRNIYFDGALAATQSGIAGRSSSTAQFTIGESPVFTGRQFSGAIDEVALYNSTLTGAQVQAIYSARAAVVPEAHTAALLGFAMPMIGGVVVVRRKKQA